MKGLRHAHAGLGYLLLVVGLIVVAWTALLAYRREEPSGASSVACVTLVGLIDLQVLIGIVLFMLTLEGRSWTWALHHPLFMIAAAVCAHVGNKQDHWALTGWFVTSYVLLLVGAYPVVSRSGSMLMKMLS